MAITEAQPAVDVTDRAAAIARATQRIRIVGWSLALGWLCSLVVMVSVGERPGSYAELSRDLRAGQVSEVELVDPFGRTWAPLPDDAVFQEVTLRWRDGLFLRTATVSNISLKPGRAWLDRARREPERVIVGSIEDHLTALGPDVRVVPGEFRSSPYTAQGFAGPGWLLGLHLCLLLGTLMMIAGPRPWRATRWAWAWLVLLVPLLGIPAYFLFGGPTGLFRPKDPRRVGLTGGAAFGLALLVGVALSAVFAAT
ncbi:PLD nuclease N-terminal domain-containing protein [Nocardioides sp.]|uniref:PLD nuclease N-terminal domain-containing protein n=1 Tax=Nocardioides sp. TaxID=35761 RepID=UPI002C5370A0|nr:PLD nuclease N-terminal domain-containing protein [Nocardioides sp.]HXH81114.1 PLD nuclease N-terminal domain-containing protein [Nocardioides sp.]